MGSSQLDFGDQNVSILGGQLKDLYQGQTISAYDLYEQHHIKTKFARDHYIKTLREMVKNGEIKSSFKDTINHQVSVLLNPYCILEF